MDRFRSGEVEVLVATTVIEVGVDVPQATVMVVESADRFGIAQLHQLRGRGRPGRRRQLVLPPRRRGGQRAPRRRGRLDQRLRPGRRGPAAAGRGDLAGRAPEGPERPAPGLVERPGRPGLLEEARRVAEVLVGEDPVLESHPDLADEVKLLLSEDEGEYLFKS